MSEKTSPILASDLDGNSIKYASPKAGLEKGRPMEPVEIELTKVPEVGTAIFLGEKGFAEVVKPDKSVFEKYAKETGVTRVFLRPIDEDAYLNANIRINRNASPLTEASKKALRIFSY